MRQTLMVVVVGLVVARPLVLGEDAGLLADKADPSGMVLTMLWFVAAAIWALWRVWARQDDLYGGLVEAGLGTVVVLVFGTTYGVAAYQHPARLISWEWLAMLVALILVRQLTVPVEEQHGLLSALLATVLTLSAFGLYQASEGLPSTQKEIHTVEDLRQKLMKQGEFHSPDDPTLALLFERVQQRNVFATFVHPNSFAGYLALLLPALVGAAVFVVRGFYPGWQKGLAALFALAGAGALWCTHSRGALLASALVGFVLGAILYRRRLGSHKAAAVVGLILLLSASVGIYQSGVVNTLLGKQESTAAVRSEYWTATWHMIQERPWFGFGPGNFGRAYLRFMPATAAEQITDPHNFALEMWATSGVFALGALLVALAAFFVSMVRSARAAPVETVPPPPPALTFADDPPPVRWTFYLGAMFGMLLAFTLRASHKPKDELLDEAIVAGVGSILWFASFALFEQIRWTRQARALVLTGGAAALLLNLLVSGGIGFPAVAGMLWIVVALALNAYGPAALPRGRGRGRGKLLLRYVPLPILLAFAVLYFVGVLLPVTSTLQTMQLALANDKVLPALEAAAKTDDPDNAALNIRLAELYGQRWVRTVLGYANFDLKEKAPQRQALEYARRAQTYDPYGPEGYEMEYALHHALFADVFNEMEQSKQAAAVQIPLSRGSLQLALGSSTRALSVDARVWLRARPSPFKELDGGTAQLALGSSGAAIFNSPIKGRSWPWNYATDTGAASLFGKFKEENQQAADCLLRYLEHDPANPRLHYQIALALYLAEDRLESAAEHALQALALDEQTKAGSRKLTNPQRKYLRQRLNPTPER